jgi:hypothetical protein
MSFPAEVTISAINFDPDSTPIDSNISYLSCFYIQRETDYKTAFLANLTTPLKYNLNALFSKFACVNPVVMNF